MHVLVTGGGGFIGSHLVEVLLRAGHSVRVVDRDPAWIVSGAELVRGDLNSPGVASCAVEGIDAVSHQAARVGLGLDFADAPDYVMDNQVATARLLSALTATGYSGRVVLASSMVVYGEGRYHCPEHGDVRPGPRRVADLDKGIFDPPCPVCGVGLTWATVGEDAILDPRSVYAATKVGQEQLAACWGRESGGSVVSLRYHNVYGPRLPFGTPYAGVAALWCTALRRGEPPRVFEDGRQARDFVHVADVAAANMAALTLARPAGSAEALNVCSGAPVTIAEVATSLSEAFGPGAPRPVVTGEYRLGDVRHVVASADRARTVLGFSSAVSLDDGLRSLAEHLGEGVGPAR